MHPLVNIEILAQFHADLMMLYFFIKNPTLGKHSVAKFEVPNAGVHCTDSLGGDFVMECLVKVETFLDQYGMK